MKKYNPKDIEKKWQKFWDQNKTFEVTEDAKKPKFYSLIEFPYPSGEGLHVGHPRPFTAMDVVSRKKRMEGFNVLYPIGFDAFGLPTENYAIKTGKPPAEVTKKNIANFTRQLKSLGYSFAWDRQVTTSDPKYYKWTQWIFLQLFKHGLAYKKNQPINWCPKDKIGLANEEVVNGCCERCGTPVEKRNKEQWMLAITKYADKLLAGLKEVDYIPQACVSQENWIGRSEGAVINFMLGASFVNKRGAELDDVIQVFTTRPDTLFGATYLVIGPEHPLLDNLADSWHDRLENREEVEQYIKSVKGKTVIERTSEKAEKTGVPLKNITAFHPVTNEQLPVWVADYVLGDYGTGAIMAVPAHDERDWEFATKFNLPIKIVVCPHYPEKTCPVLTEAYTGDGHNIESDFLNGLPTKEAKEKMIQWLEEHGVGKRQVNYKLRDWVFSRQRYWGEPIPLVYCEACKNRKYNYIIIHGYSSSSKRGFKPWLKTELEKQGHAVWNPDLPNTNEPQVEEQVQFILDKAPFAIDENTIVVGHSLGGVVVYKLMEKIKKKIAKAILVDPVFKPEYHDEPRPAVEKSTNWNFNWKKIKSNAHEFIVLGDKNFPIIKEEHLRELSMLLNGSFVLVNPAIPHFSSSDKQDGSITAEPAILEACENPGWIPLPESELPLTLPKVEKYQPTDTGESPLSKMHKWVNTKCPRCGGPAKRETDTMPNWAGSSWYFLRYCDPHNDKEFASMEKLKYWMGNNTVIPTESQGRVEESLDLGERDSSTPLRSAQNDTARGGVDWYNGGMEHTVLHLLYSRFWNQFLFDIGVVPTREPYKKRTSHGLILASDGEKMSKSRGNVVNPDEMVAKFGTDTFRTYIMFMGPFNQHVAWDTNGLVGVRRFLEKVWGLQEKVVSEKTLDSRPSTLGDTGTAKVQSPKSKVQSLLHQTIKKVSEDIEKMAFNTAVAKMMELVNEMSRAEYQVSSSMYQVLIKLLSPFAPHLAEELWEKFGDDTPLAHSTWPKYDANLATEPTITIAVQVNGKVRHELTVAAETSEEEIKKLALASEKVAKWLEGKTPKKVIYVKGRLVSVVI